VNDAASGAAVLQLEQVAFSSVNLRFDSASPATIELAQPQLQGALFELHGLITLRLLEAQSLTDVRISADAADAVAIEIEDGSGTALGLSIAAVGGRLALRRTRLDHARLELASIELESSSISNASLHGQRLDATDSAFDSLDSQVARSLLSACKVDHAQFTNCSDFTAIQGTFDHTLLADCAQDARLYGTEFQGGQLDPRLQLDTAQIDATVLGLGSESVIDAWQSTFSDVTFCADQAFRSAAPRASSVLTATPRKNNRCRSSRFAPTILRNTS
jgi:hypothetical protein